jgi:hypothetical protein
MTTLPGNLREAGAWAARHRPLDHDALDTLRPKGSLNAAKLAARIHAASQVGGDHALEVIACFGDPEGTWPDLVARELLAAWARFDRAAFARKVVAHNRQLRLQFAGFVETIEGVDHIPVLETLTAAVKRACSLEPLSRCERLWQLVLNLNYGTDDLSPIGACPRLLSLELINSAAVPAPEWQCLGALSRLQTLKLALPGDAHLGFLRGMTALRTLDLSLGRDSLGREDGAVVGELLARGLTMHAYQHEAWTAALPAGLPAGTQVHRATNGRVTVSQKR